MTIEEINKLIALHLKTYSYLGEYVDYVNVELTKVGRNRLNRIAMLLHIKDDVVDSRNKVKIKYIDLLLDLEKEYRKRETKEKFKRGNVIKLKKDI